MLLEQLADARFKTGFVDYLNERMDRARRDRREFETNGDEELAGLATRWEQFFAERLQQFEQLKRDIPRAFSRHLESGRIQILSGAATHAYLPLLLEDDSIAAQLRAGLAISDKHLGVRPTGLWLPECAYSPCRRSVATTCAVSAGAIAHRIETPIADVGISHFFVDTHLITHGKPLATTGPNGTQETNDALIFWDTKRGWGNPLDPVGVVSEPETPKVFAFGGTRA